MRHGSFVRKAKARSRYLRTPYSPPEKRMAGPLDYVRSAVVKLSETRYKKPDETIVMDKGSRMDYCGNVK